MKCLYSLVCVAVAVFAFGGCQEAQSKSSTASKTTPKVDSEVIQTAATSDAKEEKEDKAIKIGDQGPAWENLAGTDDKKHSLKDLKESKAVAVVFTCNTCPVAVAYEDRLIKLSNDYKDKGVALVAINVNKDPRNDLEAMKQRAEEKGFAFAYLFDPSQQIARDYGATVTPHVFLLDGKRESRLHGRHRRRDERRCRQAASLERRDRRRAGGQGASRRHDEAGRLRHSV